MALLSDDSSPRHFIGARQIFEPRQARNCLLSVLFFAFTFYLMRHPDLVDRPLTAYINGFYGKNARVDRIFYCLDVFPIFSGVVLMALLWLEWFRATPHEPRPRIVAGLIATFIAGLTSRITQYLLHSHIRPYYDPALALKFPTRSDPFNTLHSFPSDHVALFGGLAVTLWAVRSPYRVVASIWLAIVELSRNFEGGHYPSDLLGGAGLAAMVVWLLQAPIFIEFAAAIAKFERTKPTLFYGIAFVCTFEMACLFYDIRGITGGMGPLLR